LSTNVLALSTSALEKMTTSKPSQASHFPWSIVFALAHLRLAGLQGDALLSHQLLLQLLRHPVRSFEAAPQLPVLLIQGFELLLLPAETPFFMSEDRWCTILCLCSSKFSP
jgi:hypothetical protein